MKPRGEDVGAYLVGLLHTAWVRTFTNAPRIARRRFLMRLWAEGHGTGPEALAARAALREVARVPMPQTESEKTERAPWF